MVRELLTLYNIVNLFDEELGYTLRDMDDLPEMVKVQIQQAWGQFMDVFYGQTVGYVKDEYIEDYYEEDNYE